MKHYLFLLLCFQTGFVSAQGTDSLDRDPLFKAAKHAFSTFESKHGHFLQTVNANIHYLTWGEPSGVPLIWSHGSFSNGYEIMEVADDLVEAGYFVIAIDYYGHGQSSIPDHGASLYHVADDIKSLMDHLNIKKAVIGGWSREGYISTAFYDTYPEHTLGLILEDGGSVATNFHYHQLEQDRLEALIRSFGVEAFVEAEVTYTSQQEAFFSLYEPGIPGLQFENLAWIRETEDGRWAANPGLFGLFHHSSSEQILDNILRPTQVPLFASSMSMMEPEIIFRNLHVPVLILDAVQPNDLFPFEEENAKLQRKFPALIEHIRYENTDHYIHAAQPERFVQNVAAFLQKVKKHHY